MAEIVIVKSLQTLAAEKALAQAQNTAASLYAQLTEAKRLAAFYRVEADNCQAKRDSVRIAKDNQCSSSSLGNSIDAANMQQALYNQYKVAYDEIQLQIPNLQTQLTASLVFDEKEAITRAANVVTGVNAQIGGDTAYQLAKQKAEFDAEAARLKLIAESAITTQKQKDAAAIRLAELQKEQKDLETKTAADTASKKNMIIGVVIGFIVVVVFGILFARSH